MYVLKFNKNKSKHFQYALKFALELGAEFNGVSVVLEIENEKLLNSYYTIKTLFGYIQKWKSTKAFYNGEEVHPYRFIYYTYLISQCADKSEVNVSNCLVNNKTVQWGCNKITNIQHNLDSKYNSNQKYWYQFGYFKQNKWILKKDLIKNNLLAHVKIKGLNICPYWNEELLIKQVLKLPDFIIPDNITFEIIYSEENINGLIVQIPDNIKHINNIRHKKSIT